MLVSLITLQSPNKKLKLLFHILPEDIKSRNSEKFNAQLLKEWLTVLLSQEETPEKKFWPSELSNKPSKSLTWWAEETQSMSYAKQSWKEGPEKIPPESEKEEPSENKLSMFHQWEESGKPYTLWHSELETLPWKTTNLLLNV